MKAVVLGFVGALLLHGLVLLFGGVFFFTDKEIEARRVENVELFSEEASKPEEVVEDEKLETRPQEELEVEEEKPPDMKELFQTEEPPSPTLESPSDAVARLDAMSLAALESALSGQAGGGEAFGVGGSLASGGRIGGTGTPGRAGGDGDGPGDSIFDVSELDRRATPLFQTAPTYPLDLRRQKIEGVVQLVFIVDARGQVQSPKVESATHPGFEKPALDAVRHWRFEPAVREGEKVPSRMRIPIRFSLHG